MNDIILPSYLQNQKDNINNLFVQIQDLRKTHTYDQLTPYYEKAKSMQKQFYADLIKFYNTTDSKNLVYK